MKHQTNRMNREDRAGSDPVEVDHLIRDDRAELLRGYRSGEGGRRGVAALFVTAGGEVARGATGLLASGLLGAKGVWIAVTLLGLAGAGLIGSEIWKGDEPQPTEALRQPATTLEKAPEFTQPMTAESIDGEPVTPKSEESRAAEPSEAGRIRRGSDVVLKEAEPATATSPEPETNRQQEIRTRITIDLPDQEPK